MPVLVVPWVVVQELDSLKVIEAIDCCLKRLYIHQIVLTVL